MDTGRKASAQLPDSKIIEMVIAGETEAFREAAGTLGSISMAAESTLPLTAETANEH